MPFPNYKRTWFFWEEPDGWEDRGPVEDFRDKKTGRWMHYCHGACYSRTHVGRENGKSFYFCPKCLVKLK